MERRIGLKLRACSGKATAADNLVGVFVVAVHASITE
jgi:hypothetical protein